MNTLLRYIEANGMKNEKIESLPASELDRFVEICFNARRENGEGWEPATGLQFSAQYKLTALLRRNIHLTYPRTMSSKNPEKSLQRTESQLFWYENGNGNKPQAA